MNPAAYNEDILIKTFGKALEDGHLYNISFKKAKRHRSAFTTEQVNYLEKEFRKYPYVGNARRKDVADVLNIPERAVKIWFQNRRMKEKKDNLNKESDSDGSTQVNDQLNNVRSVQSANGSPFPRHGSLARLASRTSGEVTSTKTSKCEIASADCSKDIAAASEVDHNQSVIKNLTSPTISAEFSTVLQNYSADNNGVTVEEKCISDKSVPSHQVHQHSPLNFTQNMSGTCYSRCSPATAVPQDLSFKASSNQMKPPPPQFSPEVKFNWAEDSLYLKGFYAQPYIPPGNMIWRPVNVAPVISAPMAMAVPSQGPMVDQQNVKSNCICDCHKTYTASMLLHQTNQNPALQYVVTAVPYQNPSSKY